MTVINTNVSALRSQNASRMANQSLQTAMERLSTGKRINSAKDDAAGLAISSKMTSELKGMAVAIRNANDGISMAQTAEGAMGEVTNMLQRMKELAMQSANATLGAERGALQAETDQLLAQINDIAKTTNFNGIKLLDGSARDLKLQTGTNSGDTVAISMASVSTKDLGLTGASQNGQVTTGRIGNTGALATTDLTFNGREALASGATFTTANGLRDAINANSANSGVKATAYNEVKGGAPTGSSWAAGDLTINGDAVGAASSVEELVSNINRDVAGVTAELVDGKIVLSNDTGADITIAEANGGASKAGFSTNGGNPYSGYVALETIDGGALSIGGGASASELQNLGLNLSVDGGVKGTVVSNSAFDSSTEKLSINGVAIGSSADASAAAKAAAINAKSAETGVTATATTKATLNFTAAAIVANDTFTVNGNAVTLAADDTAESIITKINALGNGVSASANEQGEIVLTSSSGANITVANGTGTALASVSDADGATVALGTAVRGNLSLTSNNGEPIRIEGANASEMGLAEQGGAPGGGSSSSTLSISSQSAASKALEKINAALSEVSAKRGNLGAIQNRLEVTVNNLSTASVNLSDARSRIEDADFSAETTNLAKAQILSQASTAMLAQANQSAQGVMSLLR